MVLGMPQQGLFSPTPGIQFFSPEELSTLPVVDPSDVAGVHAVGYDENNPARLVRFPVDAPSGLAVLNPDGELVGPIIGRMMLASDNVVPALGEQCTLVDSLEAPTIFEPRLGDGVTVLGIAQPALTSAQIASKLGDVLIASLQALWTPTAGTAHFATAELAADMFLIKTTTGYARLINPDGSLGAQAGTGVAGTEVSVTIPAGEGLRAYGVMSVANGGSVRSGSITKLNFFGIASKIVSFSGTGLSAVTFLGFQGNRLTAFSTSGLTALVTLIISANLLTSFNGAGLSALVNLALGYNLLKSVRLVGLSLSAQTSTSSSSYGSAVDVAGCLLNSEALNQMYSDLGNGTGFIRVTGNPGVSGDTPSIATGKGYVVIG